MTLRELLVLVVGFSLGYLIRWGCPFFGLLTEYGYPVPPPCEICKRREWQGRVTCRRLAFGAGSDKGTKPGPILCEPCATCSIDGYWAGRTEK